MALLRVSGAGPGTLTEEPTVSHIRRFRSLLLVAALLAGLGATACENKLDNWPVTGEGAPAISDSIDVQVLSYLAGRQLPGATLAVTRGGRLVWSKGYGWAHRDDEVPMEPWHRSRIGSVSKLLTAIGVLQLVEDGELALDTKVYGDPGTTVDSSWPAVNEPTVLSGPEEYWEAILEGVVDFYGPSYRHDLFRMIEWASQVELGHLLTHTSGLLRSGHITQVESYYGADASELAYPDIHQAVLRAVIDEREDSSALACYLDGALQVARDDEEYTGARHRLPPFVFEPGTRSCYSNHGFGLLGHIVDERSGTGSANTYRAVIDRRVLQPLGLQQVVVPNNTHLRQAVDAWPHGSQLDASAPSGLGLQTGGWSASARDLARVLCSLDGDSNHGRVLQPETAQAMHTVAYPAADSQQPLGWDWRSGNELYKNGSTAGGVSVVMKFLPGAFAAAPQDEINVVINVNSSVPGEDMPPQALLRDIAGKVAAADLSTDYDLFDPGYPCVVEPPRLSILQPGNGHTVPLGTEIFFEAEAWDWRDRPLPINWRLPDGRRVTQPNSADGRHSLFYDQLAPGEHTIEAVAFDESGNRASESVRVTVTHDPPEVAITSHTDGDTVPAGEPLPLAGQSVTGQFFALPDSQVSWQVRRDGSLVRQGTGHLLTVPADLMQPGAYTVTFSGEDGTGAASHTITLTAEPPPPGLPTVFLRRPLADSVHAASTGGVATVQFVGAARDANGTPIAGANFRWTATGPDGETVLCAGTGTGGMPGGGGFTTPTSCEDFTADLTGHAIGGTTQYTITLEVRDADGDTATRQVTISVFTPPAG